MKTKKLLWSLMAFFMVTLLSVGFSSCSSDDDDEITVSSPSINFDDAGGTQTVSVASNANWTVSGVQSWLRVSPSMGSGNGAFTVTADKNTEKESRNCALTLVAGKATVVVTVSQSGKSIPTRISITNESTYTLNRFTVHFMSAERLVDGEELSSRDFGTLYPGGTVSVDIPTGAKGYYMATYLSGRFFFSPDYSIEYSTLSLTNAEVGGWKSNPTSPHNIKVK